MPIDWPPGFDRTPPEQRENTTKFDVGYRRTKQDIKKEIERMTVDKWRLDDVTGSGGDPSVVLRWQKDGVDYAVGCDTYTTKGDNLREAYLWLSETRMRGTRPVVTGESEFAAARLPPGDDTTVIASDRRTPPHEILGVAPDAPAATVKGAYRELLKERHPDHGGSTAAFHELQEAKEALLND